MSAITSTVVGALACQRDSYLRQLSTVVISCTPVEDKKAKTLTFEVEFQDTVLFPEGGGQPSDTGFVDETIPVTYVKREGLLAKHITTEPLKVGARVSLSLDWPKRFDYMQQHTGQHLLSAVLDRYDLPTLSWSMGEMINYVELPRVVSPAEVERISAEVNSEIKKATAIEVKIPLKLEVCQTSMPADYDTTKGVLRVVTIGTLDSNPCCGTHLALTAEIGSIALLNQQAVRGTNSRLFFLAGDRVGAYATMAHSIIKTVNATLSCQTDGLCDKVSQLQLSYKKAISRETNTKKELAGYQAREILSRFEAGAAVAFLHRTDFGLDYALAVVKEVGVLPSGKTLVLLTGEGQEGGACIVTGDATEAVVAGLKLRLKGLRGGGKGKFQGKVTGYEKGEMESVKRYLESL